jgi:CHASE2 domain-containing sensor protein/tRNA A-37 threonylcarbamoyl transferase component Bud32
MFKKNPSLWLAIFLSFVILLLAVLQIGFLESLESTTYDFRMKLRAGGPDTKTDIVLVDIDDDSLTKLGRWPWPRTLLAEMVSKIAGYNARVIGLNVMFSEPEVPEGLVIIEELREEFRRAFDPSSGSGEAFLSGLDKAQARLDRDKALADAIGSAGNVLLPVFFEMERFPQPDANLPPLIMENGLVQVQGQVLQTMHQARKITAPIDKLAEKAKGLGHINSRPDLRDGAVRREMLLVNYKGLAFPSYALKLVLLSEGVLQDTVQVFDPEEGRDGLQVGQQIIPTNSNLEFYITFTDGQAFSKFSFFDVLNDKVEASAFKDKIVLIGVSAKGVDIPQVTPLDKNMPSSMLLANSAQNLLTGGFLTRSTLMPLIELLILVLIGVYLSVLLPRLKARAGAIISLVLLILIIGAGTYLFVGPGIWMKITYPVLLIILGYAGVVTSRYFITERGKDKAEVESAEVNRMLGLSFQNQGQLDMAFDKFRRVPVDDGLKDILYNLGLDYERKRMFNKAVAVYQYIGDHDAKYRDIDAKIKKLNVASDTMIFGLGMGARSDDGTLLIDENTRPTLGRYEVTKELGKGAMGIVYEGRDPTIGRVTAIKTIRFTEEYEEEEAERIKEQFFREAETAGMLSHPHIVTIYDAGEDHDLSYIAMEFLDGYDLKEHARPDNLLPIRETIGYMADVAEALGYAHSKGVVHRDIKPANIMLCRGGMVKVTDFGIARAMASSKTKTGVVKGTPFYMSPEQITGKKVDGRTDIYSLGVVLYELLTGVQPFRADDLTALIYKITSEAPQPLSELNPKVPKAVAQIVEKALTKDREKRYQKAEHIAQHLRIVAKKMDELINRKKSVKVKDAPAE